MYLESKSCTCQLEQIEPNQLFSLGAGVAILYVRQRSASGLKSSGPSLEKSVLKSESLSTQGKDTN